MPRDYVPWRRVQESAIRAVVLTILLAALFSLFILGGVSYLQKGILNFTIACAVVGMLYMMFSYRLARFPGGVYVLPVIALCVLGAYAYSDEIVRMLGFNLLPLSWIGGELTINPWTLLWGMILGFLALGVALSKVGAKN